MTTSSLLQDNGALRPQASGRHVSPYLVNPLFDYTFICGGLAFALSIGCLSAFGTNTPAAAGSLPIMMLSALGTYLFAEPHSAATLFRLYGESANRNRFKFVAYGLPAFLAAAFIAAIYNPVAMQLLAAAYLLLIGQHVMAQCYGIAMLYAGRVQYKPDSTDKFFVGAIKYGAISLAVIQQFSTSWQRASFLGIKLAPAAFVPEPCVTALQVAVYIASAVFIASVMLKHLKDEAHMPLPAVMVLLTGALVITLNRAVSEVVWLFVPAFFHACQYLCIVFTFQIKKERAAAETTSKWQSLELVGTHFLECLLVGIILFVGIPAALMALGLPFSVGAALMFLTINLHHFAADACIWKLRDKSVSSRLLT